MDTILSYLVCQLISFLISQHSLPLSCCISTFITNYAVHIRMLHITTTVFQYGNYVYIDGYMHVLCEMVTSFEGQECMYVPLQSNCWVVITRMNLHCSIQHRYSMCTDVIDAPTLHVHNMPVLYCILYLRFGLQLIRFLPGGGLEFGVVVIESTIWSLVLCPG